MRILVLLLLVGGMAAAQVTPAPPASSDKNDVEKRGLMGSVRSVHTETSVPCRPADLSACRPPFKVDELTFTSDGWITGSTSTDASGKIVMRNVWERAGRRLIRTESEMNVGPNPQKQITRYDEQGRPIELLTYGPDGTLRERTVRHYDEAGILESTHDGGGHLLDSYIRHSDETHSGAGSTSETWTDNEIESRTVVTPTADGTRRDISSYGRDGKVSLHRVEEAGRDGTQITINTKYGSGMTELRDAAGHPLTQTVRGGFGSTKTYFDSDGRTTRVERYDSAGKVTSTLNYSYENDENGNWTKQTVTIGAPGAEPQVYNVVKRTISYY